MVERYGLKFKKLEGTQSLAKLNNTFYEKKFTGYFKTTMTDKNGISVEGVSIYSAGEPFIAYTIRGDISTIDYGQLSINSIMNNEAEKTEIFLLSEAQLKSISDSYNKFFIRKTDHANAFNPMRDATVANTHVQKKVVTGNESSMDLWGINGKFIKAVNVEDIMSYMAGLSADMGHIVIDLKDSGERIEYHLLVVDGQIIGAFSGSARVKWPEIIDQLSGKSGVIEFYYLDEPAIMSILNKYPAHTAVDDKNAGTPPEKKVSKPDAVKKPDSILGDDQAERQVLKKEIPGSKLYPDINNQTDSIDDRGISVTKTSMEEELNIFKDIEQNFVNNVEEILNGLNLSHLKKNPKKKHK